MSEKWKPRSALTTPLVLLALTLIALSSCLRQVDIAPKPSAKPLPLSTVAAVRVQFAREDLQSLRPEVSELLRSLPKDAEPDGMPLLRRDGKLFYWGIDEELPKEPFEWVRDPWGRPVVVLRAEGESEDWCLASPGPDQSWTTDGIAEVAKVGDQPSTDLEFAERAPHYFGEEETVSRRAVGDDIVLHSTGLFFRAYEAPVPRAGEIFAAVLGLLEGNAKSAIQVSADLTDELKELTKEERELASAFLRGFQQDFVLREDNWSHECKRKDGLLPRLYLWSERLAAHSTPCVWIEPREDGWNLDWDVDALFGAIEERDPNAKPAVDPDK